MGLIRRQGKDGKTLPRWYAVWTDAKGRRRQKAAYTDRAASAKLLRDLEVEAERVRSGLDPFPESKLPLAKHVEDFAQHLEASGAGQAHRDVLISRLRKMLGAMQAMEPADLTQDRAERALLALVKNRKLSHKTRNGYLAGLSEFAEWGVQQQRWGQNQIKRIDKLPVDEDATRRRALSAEEVGALCEAAKTRSMDAYLERCPDASAKTLAKLQREGAERSIIYRTAAYTGLRLNELRTLEWASLDLDAQPPSLTVQARYSKNRKRATVPVNSGLAEHLRDWQKLRERELGRAVEGSERVFNIKSQMFGHFGKDATAAGIPLETDGGVVNFHALRHTCATLLARSGVSPTVAQRLLRHSDIRQTMERYTHLELLDLAGAVERLPEAVEEAVEAELRLAVGAEPCNARATHMQRTGRPEASTGVNECPKGGNARTAPNPTFVDVYGSSGATWQGVSQAVKTPVFCRSRDSNPDDLAIERRESPDSRPSVGGSVSVQRQCNTDPDLATVAAAWPDLPDALRQGIVAMVRGATGGKA